MKKTIPISKLVHLNETCTDKDIRKIWIMLGRACNLKCRYCIQGKRELNLPKHPTKELIERVQQLADLQASKIVISGSDNRKLVVKLWGGEPLAYFESIREIVRAIDRDETIQYATETNATLLTDDHVNYFNAHGFLVDVSNDGPNSVKTRGVNVFDNPRIVERVAKLKNSIIECVLTPYSQDVYANVSFWKEVFGENNLLKFRHSFLIPTYEMPEDLFNFDIDAWRETCRVMAHNAIKEARRGKKVSFQKKWELDWFQNYIRIYRSHLDGTVYYPDCESFSHSYTVDLANRHYLCHNGFGLFAPPSTDFEIQSHEAKTIFASLYEEKRNCMHCEWNIFCKGLCPFTKHGEQMKRLCELMGVFFRTTRFVMNNLPQAETLRKSAEDHFANNPEMNTRIPDGGRKVTCLSQDY